MPALVQAFTPARSVQPWSRDGAADRAGGDVVAGADLRRVGQVGVRGGAAALGEEPGRGVGAERSGRPSGAARRRPGVADQDAAEQGRARRRRPRASCRPRPPGRRTRPRGAGRGRERVAEAGDVDAEQLELGGGVSAGEGRRAAEQPVDDDLGHRVAGRRPGPRCVRRCRRPRRSRRRRGPSVGAGTSSTTTPPRSPTRSPASRASSSRGRTPVAKTTRSTGSFEPSAKSIRLTRPSEPARTFEVAVDGAHADPELLDQPAQSLAAAVVDLDRHQPRRELDDRGLARPWPSARRPPRGRAGRRRPRHRATGRSRLRVVAQARSSVTSSTVR